MRAIKLIGEPDTRGAGAWPWPLPALAAWALAWALCLGTQDWIGAALAFSLATLAGIALSTLTPRRIRRLVVALGFPASALASGLAGGLPAWAWLLPLALLATVYPLAGLARRAAVPDAAPCPRRPGTAAAAERRRARARRRLRRR